MFNAENGRWFLYHGDLFLNCIEKRKKLTKFICFRIFYSIFKFKNILHVLEGIKIVFHSNRFLCTFEISQWQRYIHPETFIKNWFFVGNMRFNNFLVHATASGFKHYSWFGYRLFKKVAEFLSGTFYWSIRLQMNFL